MDTAHALVVRNPLCRRHGSSLVPENQVAIHDREVNPLAAAPVGMARGTRARGTTINNTEEEPGVMVDVWANPGSDARPGVSRQPDQALREPRRYVIEVIHNQVPRPAPCSVRGEKWADHVRVIEVGVVRIDSTRYFRIEHPDHRIPRSRMECSLDEEGCARDCDVSKWIGKLVCGMAPGVVAEAPAGFDVQIAATVKVSEYGCKLVRRWHGLDDDLPGLKPNSRLSAFPPLGRRIPDAPGGILPLPALWLVQR